MIVSDHGMWIYKKNLSILDEFYKLDRYLVKDFFSKSSFSLEELGHLTIIRLKHL